MGCTCERRPKQRALSHAMGPCRRERRHTRHRLPALDDQVVAQDDRALGYYLIPGPSRIGEAFRRTDRATAPWPVVQDWASVCIRHPIEHSNEDSRRRRGQLQERIERFLFQCLMTETIHKTVALTRTNLVLHLFQKAISYVWNAGTLFGICVPLPCVFQHGQARICPYLLRALVGFALARLYSTPDLMRALRAETLSLSPS